MPKPNTFLAKLRVALKGYPVTPGMRNQFLVVINALNPLWNLVEEQRVKTMTTYDLGDIVNCLLICTLRGADNWETVSDMAETNFNWFRRYLPSFAKVGTVPCPDTFRRVLTGMDEQQFQLVVNTLMEDVAPGLNACIENANLGKVLNVICVDGQVQRGTGRAFLSRVNGPTKDGKMLHIYDYNHGYVIASIPIEEKTNEIPTFQDYLKTYGVREGCIYAADALHAQSKTCSLITQNGGGFCFGLKGNQDSIFTDAKEIFTPEFCKELKGRAGSYERYMECPNGNVIVRETYVCPITEFPDYRTRFAKWEGLKALVMQKKTTTNKATGEVKVEIRYYMTTLETASDCSYAIRAEWGVESMHNSLDTVFMQDYNTTTYKEAVVNLSTVFKIALPCLNILQAIKGKNTSMNRMRLACNSKPNKTICTLASFITKEVVESAYKKAVKRLAELKAQKALKVEQVA